MTVAPATGAVAPPPPMMTQGPCRVMQTWPVQANRCVMNLNTPLARRENPELDDLSDRDGVAVDLIRLIGRCRARACPRRRDPGGPHPDDLGPRVGSGAGC